MEEGTRGVADSNCVICEIVESHASGSDKIITNTRLRRCVDSVWRGCRWGWSREGVSVGVGVTVAAEAHAPKRSNDANITSASTFLPEFSVLNVVQFILATSVLSYARGGLVLNETQIILYITSSQKYSHLVNFDRLFACNVPVRLCNFGVRGPYFGERSEPFQFGYILVVSYAYFNKGNIEKS